MTPFLRDLLRRAALIGSLGSIGLALLLAILAMGAPVAMYGAPVKLLVFLGLTAAITLGSKYAILKRSGTQMKVESSWVIGGLVVVSVFLLANQLIVRGVAVGMSDGAVVGLPRHSTEQDRSQDPSVLHLISNALQTLSKKCWRGTGPRVLAVSP